MVFAAGSWSEPSSRRQRTRLRTLATLLALLLLLLPLVAGCPAGEQQQPSAPPPQLRVTFLDVGQGDATVIEGPTGFVAVIDGGGRPGADERTGDDPGARVVVPFLRRRGISTVDLLVATHADDDHAQGLIAVTRRLSVRRALVSGFLTDGGDAHARLLRALRERRVPVQSARRGEVLDIGGGARLEVLHPPRPFLTGSRSDDNENSVVLRLTYGKSRFLFTGDAGDAAEADLLRATAGRSRERGLSADVLKVGHHGSRFSTSEPFLRAVAPSIAVISAGRSNGFGHPAPEVLERLERRGARVFRTDQHGAITVTTDGVVLRAVPTVR